MGKNDHTGTKKSYDELENSAQGLLRRLNNRYDATKVEAEKSAMKNLDSLDEPDEGAPDVVEYQATEENPVAKDIIEDLGEISEEELQKLFEKYLGGEIEPPEPADYDNVHQKILDAQEKSGTRTTPKTDVERNIDEAERYIDSITANQTDDADKRSDFITSETSHVDGTNGEPRFDVDSIEELAAYEPEIKKGKNKDRSSKSRAGEHTEENELPTDTAVLKSFGLDPQKAVTKDTGNLFNDFSLADTGDLQSTEEISARELDGETAETVAVAENTSGEFEYTDPEQNKSIFATFKSKYNFAKVRMVLTGALALLLLILENFSAVGEIFGSKELFVAVDWILTFACVAFISDRLIYAAKALAKFEFDADSITLVSFILSVITTIVVAIAAPSYEIPRMYNFAFAVCVFLNSVSLFISLRRDVYSFKIASSSKVKKTLSRIDEDDNIRTPEEMDFSDYLGSQSQIRALCKTDFVTDFFARRKENPKAKKVMRLFIPISFGIAVVIFLLAQFAVKNELSESIGIAYATFLMTVPFAAFLSYCYPMYLAARRAYTYNSAIIGDKTPEEYSDTAVIAFRDEDAFPAGKIKVKGIKIYADRNIENVIYYASSVFSRLGGPLSTVFRQATLNSVNSENVEIREIASEGVCAMVDGKHIVVGRPSYMENQCFETMPEPGDDECEGRSNRRILYLACEQIIIAKFYIQYNTTSDFVYIVRHLADAGICTSIRTADPCIDDGLLYDNKMDPEKYPVRIIKGFVAEEKSESISSFRGGVISVGSTKDIVRTMLLCDKIENVKKTNLVLKMVASVLGVAVMTLLLFTGAAAGMLSIIPALYQLFWLLPTFIVSKIYI